MRVFFRDEERTWKLYNERMKNWEKKEAPKVNLRAKKKKKEGEREREREREICKVTVKARDSE